jgi:hypothetical protein
MSGSLVVVAKNSAEHKKMAVRPMGLLSRLFAPNLWFYSRLKSAK